MLTKDGYNKMPVGKVQPGVAVSRNRSNKLRETKKVRLFSPPPAASELLTTQLTSISLRTVRFEVRTLEVHSVRRGRPQRCRRRKKTHLQIKSDNLGCHDTYPRTWPMLALNVVLCPLADNAVAQFGPRCHV